MADNQTASFDNTVDMKEVAFRFKKDKLGNKRDNVELKLPVPSVEGLQKIIATGGKELDLLLETVADQVRSVASGIVGERLDISQENFPFNDISWTAIANMERADRRSVVISDETWAAFGQDYIAVMAPVSGKSTTMLETAVQVYMKKMVPVKTNKEALAKLQGQLGLYLEHTKSGEEYAEILELLTRRIENYLKADEPQILAENL